MGIRASVRVKASRWVILLLLHGSASIHAENVLATWLANPETDIAGYKVHYGTQSRFYDHHIDVGNITSCTITQLSSGIEYFFCVTAYDTASNESAYSIELSGILGDSIPPVITSVQLMSLTEIWLLLNEKIDNLTAQDVTNYSIDHGIQIFHAQCTDDQKVIRLFTSEHSSGITYRLVVNNIMDIALPPNHILPGSTFIYRFSETTADSMPPTLSYAHTVSTTKLNVYFSKPLNPESAENTSHYEIDPDVSVYSAKLQKSNVVQLTTSQHQESKVYRLQVHDVSDNSIYHYPVLPETGYSYIFKPVEHSNPFIRLVQAYENDRVKVFFSEPMDPVSAKEIDHYTIHDKVQIQAVDLDASDQVALLQTTPHQPNTYYTLSAQGIYDKATGKNSIQSPMDFCYTYSAKDKSVPTLCAVTMLDETHLKLSFSKELDRTTAETIDNYRLSDDMNVVDADLDAAATTVYLETTTHQPGHLYNIQVSGVQDAFDAMNRVPLTRADYALEGSSGNVPLYVREVQMQDATHLALLFSRAPEAVQAVNVKNYHINNNIVIISVKIDANPRRVLLETTRHETNRLYTLELDNFQDNFFYFYDEDTIAPIITLVQPVNLENIDVLFNEPVGSEQAVNGNNYFISGNINVLGARLDATQKVVHLHTTPHVSRQLYLLQARNIEDMSPHKNKMMQNISYSFMIDAEDHQPPQVAMVRVIDAEHIEIIFDEMLDMSTALNRDNFSFEENIETVATSPGPSPYSLELQTTPLQPHQSYELKMTGLSDLYNNVLTDYVSYMFVYDAAETTYPVIKNVHTNQDGITIEFDRSIDKGDAANIQNYEIIPDTRIEKVQMDAAANCVTLLTSEHQQAKQYALIVDGIASVDRPEMKNRAVIPWLYTYYDQNLFSPILHKVKVLSESEIVLTFSQPLDQMSAEQNKNYSISDGIEIFSCLLNTAHTEVRLVTSRHRPGAVYTIQISGVIGQNGGLVRTAVPYVYWPCLQFTTDGKAVTKISYLDIGTNYYMDRNYMITQAPEQLLHARLIMTCNNDKERSDPDYLSLHLNQPSFIYIAYDSRVLAVPHWLDSQFTKTDLKIGVTDQAGTQCLWRKYSTSDKIQLGGNLAEGAEGAKSMYFVIIQEATQQLMSQYYNIRTFDNGESAPAQVVLYQNFPNPFNPFTNIEFDLPDQMNCKIVIYDILGREVCVLYDSRATAGHHSIFWNGRNSQNQPIASGVYFCRLAAWQEKMMDGALYHADYFHEIRKMIYLK